MHDVKGGNDAAATTPQDRVDAETARPTNSIPLAEYDPAKLTDRQRAGFACVRCEAEDGPMVPAGSTVHGQVFACVAHEEGEQPLTVDQLAGRACVHCGATDRPMRVSGEVSGHGDVVECVEHAAPDAHTSARAKTDAAMKALMDLAASGTDLTVSPGFVKAVVAEVAAMLAHVDQLSAEVAELGQQANKASDGALKAFRWGALAAWQLASELDMSAIDIARTALNETTRAPFTADEQQRLMDVLFDIADDRQGFKAHQGSS